MVHDDENYEIKQTESQGQHFRKAKKKKKKSHATETKTNEVKKQISIVTTDKLDGKITKRKTKGHNHGCLAKWQNNKKKYKGTQTWMSS